MLTWLVLLLDLFRNPPLPESHEGNLQLFNFEVSSGEVLVAQSCLTFCKPLWTAAHQASLSTAFSRLGYWSGLPFPSLVDLSNAGIEPGSPAPQADSLLTELPGSHLPQLVTYSLVEIF